MSEFGSVIFSSAELPNFSYIVAIVVVTVMVVVIVVVMVVDRHYASNTHGFFFTKENLFCDSVSSTISFASFLEKKNN